MIKRLTDDEVLTALREGGRTATYVVKNRLNMAAGTKRCTTSQVRRVLFRLERAGFVKRIPTSYAVMICWEAVDDGA